VNENLSLVEIEGEASVLLEYMLATRMSESTSRAMDCLALMFPKM
jgi:hypothetical protein